MCEPAGGPTRTRTRRFEAYRIEYGLLGSLGIAKGQPFNPDSRLQGILVKAAQIANDQMRVQSFADRQSVLPRAPANSLTRVTSAMRSMSTDTGKPGRQNHNYTETSFRSLRFNRDNGFLSS